VCKGEHWVRGPGGCENDACLGLTRCVANCAGCPDRPKNMLERLLDLNSGCVIQ
jgi:hypothetical protein